MPKCMIKLISTARCRELAGTCAVHWTTGCRRATRTYPLAGLTFLLAVSVRAGVGMPRCCEASDSRDAAGCQGHAEAAPVSPRLLLVIVLVGVLRRDALCYM